MREEAKMARAVLNGLNRLRFDTPADAALVDYELFIAWLLLGHARLVVRESEVRRFPDAQVVQLMTARRLLDVDYDGDRLEETLWSCLRDLDNGVASYDVLAMTAPRLALRRAGFKLDVSLWLDLAGCPLKSTFEGDASAETPKGSVADDPIVRSASVPG